MVSQSLKLIRFLLALNAIFLFIKHASCNEFEAGERAGWVVPSSNHTQFYNEWASQRRFRIGDTIRFKYRKDSVMEVNETNYKECNSNRPNFFSNSGDTVYNLNRSGFFYFISGATGHCEKGQSMIVWVLVQDRVSTSTSTGSSGFHAAKDNYVFVFLLLSLMAFAFYFSY